MRDDEPEHNQGVGDNYDTMEDERDALQSRLDAAEKENAELESALDEKNSQLSDYEYCRNEIDKARTENAELKQQLGRVAGYGGASVLLQLAELKQRCAKLEGALHEAETAMAEGDDYLSILDEADKRAKECEAEGDMFGWNFFKGHRSGTVNRSISQQATVRSIRAALAPDSGADCGTKEEV